MKRGDGKLCVPTEKSWLRPCSLASSPLVILHDSQPYSNAAITFDLNILILVHVLLLRMLLFQTSDSFRLAKLQKKAVLGTKTMIMIQNIKKE